MGTTSPDNQIMSDETVHAPIKWAQRKDRVFVTLGVQDVTGETISLTETKLSFSGTDGSGVGYATDIEFFEEIDAAASSYVVRPRAVEFLIMKKEQEEDAEHWPRLTKAKIKAPWLACDWSKYVDPDEEDQADDSGLGDFGMGGMGGMGGPGGVGGMDLSQLMAGMGGAGGMGGMGGMPDLSAMMAGMGGAGGDSDDDDIPGLDDEDDGPPPLE